MTTTHVLVLDFDGTVCLGDGPVLTYARLLDEALAAADERHPPGLVEAVLARFVGSPLDDEPAGVDEAIAHADGSPDGYVVAERVSRALGVDDAARSAAYAGARAALADGRLETTAPEGLAELLDSLSDAVHVVLVTNSPEHGVVQPLERLGLADRVDEIVTDARKPSGLPAVLDRLRADAGLEDRPDRLLSVGDIWANDLEPAAAQGSPTALVERFPAPDARPTHRATTLPELYPAIRAWATRTS
ncbi:HAD family hydrolase [Frigoribacterium sp. CFBP 8751]|jgi:FMN phosphatase YigB (HAD superfamily)|uniref:HAD family hydrolase n=1 Tax=Frigoribacterium sp. CFBP 8751 TaxID=2775277 RepID=UPI00177B083E|nr:HAD family hydrolase [Frigoribacterium sp. CFBP 8751]MBD8539956.1 HAD family hydrolase [Frigoribacterium sp. CFBP 8751]